MTQKTAEHETVHPSVHSFVQRAEKVPTADEIIELAELYLANPVEQITVQFDDLARLYDGRTDRATDYNYAGRSMQYDIFATRDAEGDKLEEIYTIRSQYSSIHGEVRTYGVNVLDENGHDYYRMIIRKDDSRQDVFSILVNDSEVTDAARREQYITDFLYRSLIATVRSTDRTPQERMEADEDALIKLQHRLYHGPKVVTSIDL